MNIINILNSSNITTFNSKQFILPKNKEYMSSIIMAIISDEDINNENSVCELRGYSVKLLVIPKKYIDIFYETPLGKLIKYQLHPSGFSITYY